jgi:hypothetical protein
MIGSGRLSVGPISWPLIALTARDQSSTFVPTPSAGAR